MTSKKPKAITRRVTERPIKTASVVVTNPRASTLTRREIDGPTLPNILSGRREPITNIYGEEV